MRASEIARLVGGRLVGQDLDVIGPAAASSASAEHVAFLEKGEPGAAGVHLSRHEIEGRSAIVVDDPLAAMARLLDALHPEPFAQRYPAAFIAPGCRIGEGTTIFPNAVVYANVVIGRDCRVHAGAVIGGPGFRLHDGKRVPHVGRVVVGDRVHIGPNCTIDRGMLDDTTIGDDCQLDAQVHVGHNVRIGRRVVIAAQSGISGSCVIEDGAVLGGQVGLADHARVGAGAQIGAQSGIHGWVPAGAAMLGSPARPLALAKRIWAASKHLPELVRGRGS